MSGRGFRLTSFLLMCLVSLALLAGCGESSSPATTRTTSLDTTTTTVPGELGLLVSP